MYPLKKTKTHLKKHGIVKICSNSALYSTWNIYMYVSLQIGSWYLRGFSADSWWAIFKLIRTGKTKSLSSMLCSEVICFFKNKNCRVKISVKRLPLWDEQFKPWLLLAHMLVSSTCIHAFSWSFFSLRVRIPPWPLAGFVHCSPEFKCSTTLVNSQLVCFCQLGYLKTLLSSIWIICFRHLLGPTSVSAINTAEGK